MFKVKYLIPLSFFLLLSFAPYAQLCNDAIHTQDGTFYGGVELLTERITTFLSNINYLLLLLY